MAMSETNSVPARIVFKSKSPRRGNHPLLHSELSSTLVMNVKASPIRDATIATLMTIETIEAARKRLRTIASRLCRARLPERSFKSRGPPVLAICSCMSVGHSKQGHPTSKGGRRPHLRPPSKTRVVPAFTPVRVSPSPSHPRRRPSPGPLPRAGPRSRCRTRLRDPRRSGSNR